MIDQINQTGHDNALTDLKTALQQAGEHSDNCGCTLCRQLENDVNVDKFLNHPDLRAVAHRFAERRFPF